MSVAAARITRAGRATSLRIARGGRLVDATPKSIRELADSAMLLSQGARRAIEMKREGARADPDVPATAAAAED